MLSKSDSDVHTHLVELKQTLIHTHLLPLCLSYSVPVSEKNRQPTHPLLIILQTFLSLFQLEEEAECSPRSRRLIGQRLNPDA